MNTFVPDCDKFLEAREIRMEVHIQDKWELRWITKSLDIPRHRLIPLLDKMNVKIYDRDSGDPYVSKQDFRTKLYALADFSAAL